MSNQQINNSNEINDVTGAKFSSTVVANSFREKSLIEKKNNFRVVVFILKILLHHKNDKRLKFETSRQ